MMTTMLVGGLATAGCIPLVVPLVVVPLVAFSRLLLGAHFVGDVVFSALVGAVLLFAHRRYFPVLAARVGGLPLRGQLALGLGAALLMLPAGWLIPEGWLLFGVVLGLGVGLPVEPRLVGYEPVAVGNGRQALKVALGFAALAVPAVTVLILGVAQPWSAAAAGAVGALWVVVGAPAAFARLGWAKRAHGGAGRRPPPRSLPADPAARR